MEHRSKQVCASIYIAGQLSNQEIRIHPSLQALCPLASDPPGQLNVLGHDGDPLGMDGTEVGVLKESNQVGLAGFLEGHHSRALEPQISLEVLSNLTDKPLEWKLADEQLCGLLVPKHVTC